MKNSKNTKPNTFLVGVNFMNDRKIRRIVRSCGHKSVAVIMQLLCLSYSNNCFYLKVDSNLAFDVASTLNTDEAYVNSVISAAVESEFFDKKMFNDNNVLTTKCMPQGESEALKETNN